MTTTFTKAIKIARNAVIDSQYGELLGVNIKPTKMYPGVINLANSDYQTLDYIFANRIKPDDVLVDIGCGKGRVLNWWLRQKLDNRIIGVELDWKIAAATQKRLQHYPNVTILAGDAVKLIPPEGTLFYLFNPFGEETMLKFRDKMAALFAGRKPVTILYYNCKHVDLFKLDPRWVVEEEEEAGDPASENGLLQPLAVMTLHNYKRTPDA